LYGIILSFVYVFPAALRVYCARTERGLATARVPWGGGRGPGRKFSAGARHRVRKTIVPTENRRENQQTGIETTPRKYIENVFLTRPVGGGAILEIDRQTVECDY